MKNITLKDIQDLNLNRRFAQRYGISEGAIKQMLIQLDTDWSLGRYKYRWMTVRLQEMYGVLILPRQIRYMHNLYRHSTELYKQLKRGGSIQGSLVKNLYVKC